MKCFFFYEFFRLCWVFVAALRLSLVLESGGCSCCGAQASHGDGVSCCGAWALGALASVGATQTLVSCGSWALGHAAFSTCGSRAPQHEGSSQTRDRTCIGRWILIHCATGEVRICEVFIKVQAL